MRQHSWLWHKLELFGVFKAQLHSDVGPHTSCIVVRSDLRFDVLPLGLITSLDRSSMSLFRIQNISIK